MNNQVTKIALVFIGALSLAAVHAQNANTTVDMVFPELTQLDQPFCFFKTTSKDPYMIKYHPGTNQVTMYMCGAVFAEEHSIGHVKKAIDLENLAVIRDITVIADANVQIDNKRVGYREPAIARMLESLLIAAGILSGKPYSGNFMVDEYLAGMPMKWVLNSEKELTHLITYLETRLAVAGVTEIARKPLLAISFAKPHQQLSEENRAALVEYFTLVEQGDARIKPYYDQIRKFYENGQQALNDAMAKYGKDTIRVKQTLGEIVVGEIEKSFKEFKTTELLAAITAFIIMKKILDPAQDCAKKTVDEKMKTYNVGAKEIAGCAATALVVALVVKMMQSSDDDEYGINELLRKAGKEA